MKLAGHDNTLLPPEHPEAPVEDVSAEIRPGFASPRWQWPALAAILVLLSWPSGRPP